MPHVALRPPHPGDVPAITAALQDAAVARWLTAVPWPYTAADGQAFVTRLATPADLTITVDGAFAGMIRSGPELGFWLAPQWQGKGIGTRAGVLALTRHFDAGADLSRAEVMAGNAPSLRLLARLGFEDAGPAILTRAVTGEAVPGHALRLSRERFAATHPLVIETPRCRIAPPARDDLPALMALATRPEVARMLFLFGPDMTAAEFAATHPPYAVTRPFRLAIRSGGRLIGSIGMGAGPRAEVFYFLDPATAGQGLASEVVPAFCDEIALRYAPEALVAEVFDDNPASARILQKAGFTRDHPTRPMSRGRGETAPAHHFTRVVRGLR